MDIKEQLTTAYNELTSDERILFEHFVDELLRERNLTTQVSIPDKRYMAITND